MKQFKAICCGGSPPPGAGRPSVRLARFLLAAVILCISPPAFAAESRPPDSLREAAAGLLSACLFARPDNLRQHIEQCARMARDNAIDLEYHKRQEP